MSDTVSVLYYTVLCLNPLKEGDRIMSHVLGEAEDNSDDLKQKLAVLGVEALLQMVTDHPLQYSVINIISHS